MMMQYHKTLTVSIAAYNVENTIRRALDSLVDQKNIDDIEIFVVDDGGKDGTLDIAREYARKYPTSVFPVHKENGGYGSTINYSIQHATGKYFKQLDGDDWLITENLSELISILKAIDSDCVITEVADYKESSGRMEVHAKYTNLQSGEYSFSDTILDPILTMHGTIIRTDILKENGIKLIEKCFYSDTELVVFPMAYMNSFYLWKYPLYVYVTGREGQSMSFAGIKKHYQDHDKVFWELIDSYKTLPLKADNKRRLVFKRLKKEAYIHFRFLLQLDINSEHCRELKTFCGRIKWEMPDLYNEIKCENKKMRILWKTGYVTYPIFAVITRKKYN